MQNPTLVVLAAGMGSRYGGLKQIEPMGPAGETMLDYSVFDALRVGFDKVVFVIRREFEGAFRDSVGAKFTDKIETADAEPAVRATFLDILHSRRYDAMLVETFVHDALIQQHVALAVRRRDDGDTIVSAPGDPALVFDITRPINQRTAEVDGVEINLQHAFGDSGFGVIVNATVVDADVAYDDTNFLEGQFVLNGLSDSANLIGFYDGEDLQVRLAYNWRDDFIAGVGQAEGTRSSPTNVEAYGQWDLGVTYHWTDNLTMNFSGLNITNETRHVYGLTKKQTLQAVQTGPRWDLGIRYNFDM